MHSSVKRYPNTSAGSCAGSDLRRPAGLQPDTSASSQTAAAIVPTVANLINIAVQVVLSYPTMKFWIMPSGKERAVT